MKNSMKLLGILALTMGAMHTQAAALGGDDLTAEEIQAFVVRARADDPDIKVIRGQNLHYPHGLTATAEEPVRGGLQAIIDIGVEGKPVVIVDNIVTIGGDITVSGGVNNACIGSLVGKILAATRERPVIIAYNEVRNVTSIGVGHSHHSSAGGLIGWARLNYVYVIENSRPDGMQLIPPVAEGSEVGGIFGHAEMMVVAAPAVPAVPAAE